MQIAKYLSMQTTSDFAISIKTFLRGLSRYFPPQFNERDRSLPVPKGIMPIAGRRPLGNDDFIESITERTHPTVPSPPQATKMGKMCYCIIIYFQFVCNEKIFFKFMVLMSLFPTNVQKQNQTCQPSIITYCSFISTMSVI